MQKLNLILEHCRCRLCDGSHSGARPAWRG